MIRLRSPLLVALVFLAAAAGVPGAEAPGRATTFADVTLQPRAFNALAGDRVTVAYTLRAQDQVTVRVYDADGGLIRTLLASESQGPGRHELVWDGRDDSGRAVPNEAYTAVLEAASGAVHDPFEQSGGLVGDITDARIDADGTVSYRLPVPSRVLIRLGIRSGPMLRTLVDWKPRIASAITEVWNGRDEDGLVSVREHPDLTALVTYVTLPEATVVAFGNDQETYRAYKLGRGKDRPVKTVRVRRADPEFRLRPEQLVPPAWARAPRVRMTFPQSPDSPAHEPVPAHGAIDVRIDVEPSDRALLLDDEFEVILFVDHVFFAEAERGYLPLNWRWELHQLPPGEHLLTVNIASFRGQVGVTSRKVMVVK